MNDGICPELCPLRDVSVDMAAEMVLSLGVGALMVKVDLESAYWMIPIHPDDRWLLGMLWNGLVWLDTTLPFGLRSAPKIFNAMADGLQWIIQHQGVEFIMYYLDDFLLAGPPNSAQCKVVLETMLSVCERLGVRVSLAKLEGPATTTTFLGIVLDTVRQELHLPDNKLSRLCLLVKEWLTKRSCTKRDLLSLIGVLTHACKVVRPGHSFLRRMIELSKVAHKLHHHIRLNAGFRSDLQWWAIFLPR